ncbi:MAG: DUF5060 domain-containing protein, partial [Planctomycetota bacterium]
MTIDGSRRGCSFCLAASVLLGGSEVRADDRVGRWDRFEASVQNSREYRDPYRDVSLTVTYTRPDGGTVDFRGFYDGEKTWKLRFMPGQLGTWRYTARFSDGAPGRTGAFECIRSDVPGMLTLDRANPIWFGFTGGRRALVRGLHVGDRFFAENWLEADRKAFLDWAERQGYNLLSVASHYLNRNSEGRGKGWKTPDLWPPNAGEFRKLEARLDDLAARRIMVYPFAGFFGRDSDFPKKPEDQAFYVRYTLTRLGPYWNVLFNVAGPEPNLGKANYLPSEDVARLGRLIRQADVFGHPLSVHNRTGDDPYRDSAWSTFGTLQGPKTTDRAKLSAGLLRNHHDRKTLFAQETLWAGNKNHPAYSHDDLRKNAYVIHMSAAAMAFGDMAGNSSSGFSGSMDLDERVQRRHDVIREVWDFFETVPYHRMRPRQDLISRGYCLAEPGREYLVYLDAGGRVDVKLEDGPYLVQWINAQRHHDRRYGGETTNGSGLTAPGDGDDWLVRLRRPTARFSIRDDNTGTALNDRPFLAAGLRVSNALVSEEKTRELIDSLDELASCGVNTLSVFFQGSRFGDVKGYRRDGSLDPVYAVRMGRIIEAADRRGMVVLVGCLYYGNS